MFPLSADGQHVYQSSWHWHLCWRLCVGGATTFGAASATASLCGGSIVGGLNYVLLSVMMSLLMLHACCACMLCMQPC